MKINTGTLTTLLDLMSTADRAGLGSLLDRMDGAWDAKAVDGQIADDEYSWLEQQRRADGKGGFVYPTLLPAEAKAAGLLRSLFYKDTTVLMTGYVEAQKPKVQIDRVNSVPLSSVSGTFVASDGRTVDLNLLARRLVLPWPNATELPRTRVEQHEGLTAAEREAAKQLLARYFVGKATLSPTKPTGNRELFAKDGVSVIAVQNEKYTLTPAAPIGSAPVSVSAALEYTELLVKAAPGTKVLLHFDPNDQTLLPGAMLAAPRPTFERVFVADASGTVRIPADLLRVQNANGTPGAPRIVVLEHADARAGLPRVVADVTLAPLPAHPETRRVA